MVTWANIIANVTTGTSTTLISKVITTTTKGMVTLVTMATMVSRKP